MSSDVSFVMSTKYNGAMTNPIVSSEKAIAFNFLTLISTLSVVVIVGIAANVCVCDVAGLVGQMKEVRLICPTTPKLSHETERCLKTKLRIYSSPRNGTYILLAACGLVRPNPAYTYFSFIINSIYSVQG